MESAGEFADSIVRLKENMRICSVCHNLSERELCAVCENVNRDRKIICVVEDHKHLLAIEKTGVYKGLYHVLMGTISPTEGRGPEDLKLNKLIERIEEDKIEEIVIATDPDIEGEMTALHIANEVKPLGVKISRIGLGIPMGSSVEFADVSTLTVSMSSRSEM